MNGFDAWLAAARKAHSLSQGALARQLGVDAAQVGHWEAGRSPVPQRFIAHLASILAADAGYVKSLWLDARSPKAGHVVKLKWLPRGQMHVRRYPVRGSVQKMIELDHRGTAIYEDACARLSPSQQMHLRYRIPRDSALELAAMYQFIAYGFVHARRPLHDLRWLYPALDRVTGSVINHLPIDMFLLTRPTFQVVAVPQVTVPIVKQSYTPRLDFLTLYTKPEGHVWVDVEIDGYTFHRDSTGEDARRARGLGLVRVAFDGKSVYHEAFVDRLLARLEDILLSRLPRVPTEFL